jgi:acyl-CoA thioesterase-1
VVILAGTNDVAGNTGPASLDAIEDNLASMAELSRAHDIRVVLASVLPITDQKMAAGTRRVQSNERPPATLRALNTWIAEYARDAHHVYLDYAAAMADATGALRADLTDDGLHPNAAGYAVMAPLAEQAIARALAP